jgi:hypothetical protein
MTIISLEDFWGILSVTAIKKQGGMGPIPRVWIFGAENLSGSAESEPGHALLTVE